MADTRKHSLTIVLATLLLLPAVYVLSYAPVYRVQFGSSDNNNWHELGANRIPGYQPVEWMIDETMFRELLLWWSGLCGVREGVSSASRIRIWYLNIHYGNSGLEIPISAGRDDP